MFIEGKKLICKLMKFEDRNSSIERQLKEKEKKQQTIDEDD